MAIKSIKSSFKNFSEKKAYLDKLYYKIGKQGNDFELCFMDEKKDKKSKWRKYSVIGFDVEDKQNKMWVEISNNRTILKNEVVLDLEDPKRYKKIIAKLDKDGLFYRSFKTGSKGYHFHLIYNTELTSDEKLDVIKKYDCDTQKSSDRCMIALEFEKHWKTGKPKELVLEKKGINKYEKRELTEEEELEILRANCLDIEYTKSGQIKKVNVSVSKVAYYLLNKYDFKTIFETKSEKIYLFSEGIYVKDGRETIQTQTEKILGQYCTNHYISEIVEKIKRKTAIPREKFENVIEELICLENGVLNLKTGKFEEHNPDYYFKVKLPIEYNSKADCPKIKNFFEETLYPDDVKVIQEWFGYCLYRRYFIKKAMISFGITDTGKSVMLNLLSRWLGENNISGLSLQRISSGDKFRLVSLFNKYSNVFDDLTSEDMIAGGFKIATGGGNITAEHKFGDQFLFRTYAKLIFAGNKIPAIKEIDSEDSAYYDRWLPIPFDNQIPKSKQDKFLIDKLTTKKELSGLLNYALKGLKRLLENGQFSYKKDWKEIKQIMERHSNSLSAFCQDVLIEKQGNKISGEIMYEIYCAYVKMEGENRGFARLSREQLGRRLSKYAPYILAKRSKKRYWENVDISKLHIKDDTLDAFSIIYSRNGDKNNTLSSLIYKKSKEVSKVSKPINTFNTIKTTKKPNRNSHEKTNGDLGSFDSSGSNFKCLKNLNNLVILKNKKQTNISLKKDKKYKISILGDNSDDVLKILLDDKKIKLLENKKNGM